MRWNVRWLAVALVPAVGLGLWMGSPSGSAADPTPTDLKIPDDQVKSLIEANASLIKDALDKDKFDQKALGRSKSKLKFAAMDIALLSQLQAGGANAKSMATLRDAAVKFTKDVDALNANPNLADLKKAADMLKMDIAADAKADPKAIALHAIPGGSGGGNVFELHDVMTVFKAPTGGGLGLEKYIRDSMKKVDDPKKLATAAYMSLMAVEYGALMPPQGVTGPKLKQWEKYSDDSKKASLELAAAASGGKAKEKDAMAAAKKLDGTCTICHNTFRVD
jgi:hypothetical protein